MGDIEWLKSLVSDDKAFRITGDMTKEDVIKCAHRCGMMTGLSSLLIDYYGDYTDFSDGDFYIYYDIRFLSGSAGYIKVNEDKITARFPLITS